MSFNTALENRTPFEATTFVFPDTDGQEILLIVMAATFVAKDGNLRLADEPSPIRSSDEYRGDPARSSTLFEADVALVKPFVDVIVNGHVYAQGGVETSQVAVRLAIGDVDKTLLVTGDRSPLGRASAFKKMPIVYERAFGGTDEKGRLDQRNPVGVGYQGARSADQTFRQQSPTSNILREGPSQRALAPWGEVGSLESISPGTYDATWLDKQWPLLPTDFDPRHYQAAPLDQQSRIVRGGEDVRVVNMTPKGTWRFRLPTLDVAARLLYEDRQQVASLSMDTVLRETRSLPCDACVSNEGHDGP